MIPAIQNTIVGCPVMAAAIPPSAGPIRNPPVCADPYTPKASPCRSGGFASTM